MSYLFDTTVLIDWSVAHPGVKAAVERCYDETVELYTCDVVVCEALSAGSEVEREVIRRIRERTGVPVHRSRRRSAGW